MTVSPSHTQPFNPSDLGLTDVPSVLSALGTCQAQPGSPSLHCGQEALSRQQDGANVGHHLTLLSGIPVLCSPKSNLTSVPLTVFPGSFSLPRFATLSAAHPGLSWGGEASEVKG